MHDLNATVYIKVNCHVHCVMCGLQPGSSSHDPVNVPFTLPPGAQNEGQFIFNIQDITMPQKLKGTLTYMLQVNM